MVAHRGGIHIGAENRIATFKKALALGVDAIEMDIHQSRDGHLMVIHDLTLDHAFGRPGRVDRMTRAELEKAGVPSLEDAADLLQGKCLLVIEIKQPKDGTRHRGIERRLVEFIAERKLSDSVIIISFYADSMRKVNDLAPHLDKAFLFGSTPKDLKATKRDMGLTYLGPKYTKVDEDFMKRAKELGLKVNPWTVDGKEKLEKFVDLGCDAITTNDPDILLGIVGRSWFR